MQETVTSNPWGSASSRCPDPPDPVESGWRPAQRRDGRVGRHEQVHVHCERRRCGTHRLPAQSLARLVVETWRCRSSGWGVSTQAPHADRVEGGGAAVLVWQLVADEGAGRSGPFGMQGERVEYCTLVGFDATTLGLTTLENMTGGAPSCWHGRTDGADGLRLREFRARSRGARSRDQNISHDSAAIAASTSSTARAATPQGCRHANSDSRSPRQPPHKNPANGQTSREGRYREPDTTSATACSAVLGPQGRYGHMPRGPPSRTGDEGGCRERQWSGSRSIWVSTTMLLQTVRLRRPGWRSSLLPSWTPSRVVTRMARSSWTALSSASSTVSPR